jgi:hypothetical protein
MPAYKDIKTEKRCITTKLYLLCVYIQERNLCIQEAYANVVLQSVAREQYRMFSPLSHAATAPSGRGLLTVGASRSYSDTHYIQ